MWVSAKAAGESVVHVTVVSRPVGFPAQTFTRSVPFTVVAPLQLISPSSILLWPGATATIRTNADVNEKYVTHKPTQSGHINPALSEPPPTALIQLMTAIRKSLPQLWYPLRGMASFEQVVSLDEPQ